MLPPGLNFWLEMNFSDVLDPLNYSELHSMSPNVMLSSKIYSQITLFKINKNDGLCVRINHIYHLCKEFSR